MVIMIIIRFLMTKAVIIVIMQELVAVAVGTVITMTYRRSNMEKKKLDLIKKLVRLDLVFIINVTNAKRKC